MRTEDFEYNLPQELIAQYPADPRDSCRLLVLDRASGEIEHETFTQIIDHLNSGDLLVANETRVMPARLIGQKPITGGAVEALLLRDHGDNVWECLVRPGRRLKSGARMEFRFGGALAPVNAPVILRGTVRDICGVAGERMVEFEPLGCTLDEAFHKVGDVPLPPYITGYEGDREMYQTVFSKAEHSAAAPTAGLHFTNELIERIKEKGVAFETVELEVGVDTFRVVTEDDPALHRIHTEQYHVPQRVVDAIHATKERGGRVIAVGTTSVRSLESAWDEGLGDIRARTGEKTSLYIMPGYTYHVVDALITNFHVPRSTLMLLVSAFAGRENIMTAYEEAVRMRYRLLSFGDAMFIG
ncbi:MAG: tRNA preQ1(34) S-adenosylmethionine ribosyltransferase-isomerase QueA [Actinobacteria bacterium]|nr:tRNA preQ1(34) S-adenosylmethionine ribosyltransferase-isomerase QueA [Actinomycetota bacterium]